MFLYYKYCDYFCKINQFLFLLMLKKLLFAILMLGTITNTVAAKNENKGTRINLWQKKGPSQ